MVSRWLVGLGVLVGCAPDAAGPDAGCSGGGPATWYADHDADGFGDAAAPISACTAPDGGVPDSTDCDDGAAQVHPGAAEACNDVDDDCDGQVDEDPAELPIWYADLDHDGYGDPASPTSACDSPADSVADAGDCDDADATVHPGQRELCNAVDDDCDATTSEAGTATFTDEAGAVTDWRATLTGWTDAPSSPTLDEAGTLRVCAGTWYTNLLVTADVTIQGLGDPILDGAGAGTVVAIEGNALEVTIRDLTVQGGAASVVAPRALWGFGGGLACASEGEATALDLRSVTVTGNEAQYGGAIAVYGCDARLTDVVLSDNRAAYGGGVYADGAAVELSGASTVSGNVASATGGGLHAMTGEVTAGGATTLSGNTATLGGGGLYSFGGPVTLADAATLTENVSTGTGGGAQVADGTLVVDDDATVSTNTAEQDGGGVYLMTRGAAVLGGTSSITGNATAGSGGGVYTAGGGVGVTLSGAAVLAHNTAAEDGGGLYLADGAASLGEFASIRENDADGAGGGVYAADATLRCEGSATLWLNTATVGGGAYLDLQAELDLDGCDLGSGTSDNAPDDVNNWAHNAYLYDGAASVGCGHRRCGDLVTTEVGTAAPRTPTAPPRRAATSSRPPATGRWSPSPRR